MDEGRINATEEAPRQTGGDGTVNLIVNSETIKPFAWFAGAMISGAIVLSVLGLTVGVYGVMKADEANAAAQNSDMEARIAQSKIESLRNEVAKLTGLTEAQRRP